MKIFIAGGGRVGSHLARLLTIENHSITVVESDPNKVEQLDNTLDIRTALGNAASVLLLQQLGAGEADMFVSMTGSDEINFIAAATAKGLGAKQTVARVHNPLYVGSNVLYEALLGIDYVLSPEALTALEIAHFIERPGLVAAQDFADGLVKMLQMRIAKTSPIGGKPLKDVCPPGMGVLVGAISRNGKITVPHGDSTVEPGDLVTLIGERDRMAGIVEKFQGTPRQPKHIAVMGGGSIGLHLARALETRPLDVKLFDWDLETCQDIAAELKKTEVVHRDATSRSALEEEHVDKFDMFVATANDDEQNIMASVLAKEMGASYAVVVVHQPDFAPLVSRLGIDHTVTPRASIANRVLRLVHQDQISVLAVLEEGQVEILELKVKTDAPIVGETLRESRAKLPRGVLVATIQRDGEVIVPSGDDRLLPGDSVVLLTALESLDAVQKLFVQ